MNGDIVNCNQDISLFKFLGLVVLSFVTVTPTVNLPQYCSCEKGFFYEWFMIINENIEK